MKRKLCIALSAIVILISIVYGLNLKIGNKNEGKLPGNIEKADEETAKNTDEAIIDTVVEDNRKINKLANNTGMDMQTYTSISNFIIPYPKDFKLNMIDNNHIVLVGENMSINILSEPTYLYENYSANSLAGYFDNFSSCAVYVDDKGVYRPISNFAIDNGDNDKEISEYAVVSGSRENVPFTSPDTLISEYDVTSQFAVIKNLPVAIYIIHTKEKKSEADVLSRYMISNIDKIKENNQKANMPESVTLNTTVGTYNVSFSVPTGFSEIEIDNQDMKNAIKQSEIIDFKIYKYPTNYQTKLSNAGIAVFMLGKGIEEKEYFLEDILGKINGFFIDPNYKGIYEFTYTKYPELHPFEVYNELVVKDLEIDGYDAKSYSLDISIVGGFNKVVGNEKVYNLYNNVIAISTEKGYLYFVIKGDQSLQEDEINEIATSISEKIKIDKTQ